jgi:hypothetical protein
MQETTQVSTAVNPSACNTQKILSIDRKSQHKKNNFYRQEKSTAPPATQQKYSL